MPKQQRLALPTTGRDRRNRRAASGNRRRPIEFCLSDLRRADRDCRDEPTDDVIMSMASQQSYNEDISSSSPFPFFFFNIFFIFYFLTC